MKLHDGNNGDDAETARLLFTDGMTCPVTGTTPLMDYVTIWYFNIAMESHHF